MSQVASDPKIHAHSHTLARLARPTQQPDRATSPFESLLDDGAQASDQPPPTSPESKTTTADSSRAPTKTKDAEAVAATDNGTTKQPDDVDPLDTPEGGGKPVTKNNAVDVKLMETAAAGDGKPSDDGKPTDGQKTDNTTVTPPTDNSQTISAADTIVPTPSPGHTPDSEHIVQLPEQASSVAEIATQSKPVDPTLVKLAAGKPADSGKPVDVKKQGESGQQVDADQSADEPAVDPNLTTKSAPQPHADSKPQPATTDSDKQHIDQARGEIPANSSHAGADTPVTAATDGSKGAPDITAPVNVSTQPHAAPTAAAPALLVSQPGLQPAAVPLAGVPLEITGKALAGKNRFEIRLDPPELGRIEVRLDVDRDGNVTSRLTVDRAETLDLLRRDASGLERALQDAGLKTGDNGLQFALRDQSMSQQQTSSGSDNTRLVVTDETLPSIDANLQNYNRLAGQGGGLDIRV